MRLKKFFFLLIILNTFCWGMLSVDEAAQVIRQFEGIPDLRLKYLGLNTELTDEGKMQAFRPFIRWPIYCFETDYEDKEYVRSYGVDPYTGQIVLWYDDKTAANEAISEENSPDISGMLSPAELYSKALIFIQKMHPDFNPSQYDVVFMSTQGIYDEKQQLIGSAGNTFLFDPNNPHPWPPKTLYETFAHIMFVRHLTDGYGDEISDYSSQFLLSMGSHTGNIVGFGGHHFPLNISLTPTINEEVAKQIALSVILQRIPQDWHGVIDDRVKFVSLNYNSPPNCMSLYWRFYIKVFDSSQASQGGFGITIDAHTGEVVFVGRTLERTLKKFPKEKFKEFKRIAIKAKRIKPDELWSIINEQGGEEKARAKIIGRRFYLSIGQTWCLGVLVEKREGNLILKYKDKTKTLEEKDIIKKGAEMYIPLAEMLDIAGYHAKYLGKDRLIYIQKRDDRKEKAEGAIGGTLSLSALSYALWKFLRILA
jgi:hypothetical protein